MQGSPATRDVSVPPWQPDFVNPGQLEGGPDGNTAGSDGGGDESCEAGQAAAAAGAEGAQGQHDGGEQPPEAAERLAGAACLRCGRPTDAESGGAGGLSAEGQRVAEPSSAGLVCESVELGLND